MCFLHPTSVNKVFQMASKYKAPLRKKHNTELGVVVSSLNKENDFLKKTLVEALHHFSTLNRLLERFLSLETVRLEGSQLPKAKNRNALPKDQLCEAEDNPMDGQGSTSDEQALTDDVRTLQNNLKDALEKNKQWLEYDQQREACVRAILARMLWLEKQLNEANGACLQQHNEDHSDEKAHICQMQEHYESLLQEANNELEVLRYQLGETSQELMKTQDSFKEREKEIEELRQHWQTLRISRGCEIDHQSRSNEEEQQRAETKDLRHRLAEEKHKLADLELQEDIHKSLFIDTYEADQQKIADLERQIRITSQDLEDERQDCLYLRKKKVKLLEKLSNSRGHLTKPSTREQQDRGVTPPPSPSTEDGFQSSPNSSLLDESCLECPLCQIQYSAHQHRDLIYHLEVCHS